MRLLFVGIEEQGAVSRIMKDSIKLISKKENVNIFCYGFGDQNKSIKTFATFFFHRPFVISRLFIRFIVRIKKALNQDSFLCRWRSAYRYVNKLVKIINPDCIICSAGPFYYMKASYEVAKKNNIKLSLIFFDPFENNPVITKKPNAIKEAKKWIDYSAHVLYDADTNPPIGSFKSNKMESFYIPIFERKNTQRKNNQIIYGGSFYPVFREPSLLIDFINIVDNSKFVFKIYTENRISELIKRKTKKEVFCCNPISEENFNETCDSCAAIIAIGNGNQINTIPSKVLEAIGHKKPIIGLNFNKDIYYLKKYPFYFNGNNLRSIDFIKDIQEEELANYNIYSNFPERDPKIFIKKILKIIIDYEET